MDFERKSSSVALFLILIVLLLQVFTRLFSRFGLLTPPIWTEEFARWVYVWMIALSLGELERKDENLRVLLLYEKLPPKLRNGLDWLFDGTLIFFLIRLILIAINEVQRNINSTATILPFNLALLYGSFLIGFLFTLLRVIQRIVKRIRLSNQTMR